MEIVERWSQRVVIIDNLRSGRPLIFTEEIQVKTVAFYCQTNSLKDCGRWTLRFAEKYLNANLEIIGQQISGSTIQRILKKQNLKLL